MKFKQVEESIYSSDPPYDLFVGGYINPYDLLEDSRDAEKVVQAMALVERFLRKAEEAGVLEIG